MGSCHMHESADAQALGLIGAGLRAFSPRMTRTRAFRQRLCYIFCRTIQLSLLRCSRAASTMSSGIRNLREASPQVRIGTEQWHFASAQDMGHKDAALRYRDTLQVILAGAAVAVSATVSALGHGWVWWSPITNRSGSGLRYPTYHGSEPKGGPQRSGRLPDRSYSA